IALFVGLSLLYFSRSWSSYFVCDDYLFLGRVDLSSAFAFLTRPWAYGGEYRPILPFSYAFDALLSGESPVGYHLTNTVIHIANAVLLGFIARAKRATPFVAAFASLLFLVNPVIHESVLWISGRPVILSALFMLASILLFIRAEGRNWVTGISLSL